MGRLVTEARSSPLLPAREIDPRRSLLSERHDGVFAERVCVPRRNLVPKPPALSFEEALAKRFSPKSLEGLTIPADGMNADIHGSAEYRAHLVGVLARRAAKIAFDRASGKTVKAH